MEPRNFLDAAIDAADSNGQFKPESVSRQFNLTKGQQRTMGIKLRELKMLRTGTSGWQLLGVAGELARALNDLNVDSDVSAGTVVAARRARYGRDMDSSQLSTPARHPDTLPVEPPGALAPGGSIMAVGRGSPA
jgi:hypothetical protein